MAITPAQAAEKAKFQAFVNKTPDGQRFDAAIVTETARLQQERQGPRGGRSHLVAANVPINNSQIKAGDHHLRPKDKDGRPDFSKAGYQSAIKEQAKQYGTDYYTGGGSTNSAVSFMSEGWDGTKDVANRTQLKIDTTNRLYTLTQYRDKSFELRDTLSGGLQASGSEWNAKAKIDAEYMLSGDFLSDKKNVPLDYKPPTMTGKMIRIIDDNRGPIDVSAYNSPTVGAYKNAGLDSATASFMGSGLSKGQPVKDRYAYLSRTTLPSGEDVFRRYWMEEHDNGAVELRSGGGQIVLSSGTNDHATIDRVLSFHEKGDRKGSTIYRVEKPVERVINKIKEPIKDLTSLGFSIMSPESNEPLVQYGSTPSRSNKDPIFIPSLGQTNPNFDGKKGIFGTDTREAIGASFSRYLVGTQDMDAKLPKLPEIVNSGVAYLLSPGPAGSARFTAELATGKPIDSFGRRVTTEILDHPTETVMGAAAIAGYGIYDLTASAVTDPIGAVSRLPQTVPEAAIGIGEAFVEKPIQTALSFYIGGKILPKLPGKRGKPAANTGTPSVGGKSNPGSGAGTGGGRSIFEIPEQTGWVGPGEPPIIWGGGQMAGGWPVEFKMPTKLTISDANSILKPSDIPTIEFKPGGMVEIKGMVKTYDMGAPGKSPFSLDMQALPELIETTQVVKRAPNVKIEPNFGVAIESLDMSPIITHTDSIGFGKKGASGVVVEQPILGYKNGKPYIEGYKSDFFEEPRTGHKKGKIVDNSFDMKKIIEREFSENKANEIRHKNAMLESEFGSDILKADSFHIGPLDTIDKKRPATPNDLARIKTPKGQDLHDYILWDKTNGYEILNFDKIERIVGTEKALPEGARTYDLVVDLDYIRNPDALKIMLEPTEMERAYIESKTGNTKTIGDLFDISVELSEEKKTPNTKGSKIGTISGLPWSTKAIGVFDDIITRPSKNSGKKPKKTKKQQKPEPKQTSAQKDRVLETPKVEEEFPFDPYFDYYPGEAPQLFNYDGTPVVYKYKEVPAGHIRTSERGELLNMWGDIGGKSNPLSHIKGYENTKLIFTEKSDPIWGRIDLDKSANVPRNTKLILAKDSDPIWGRIDLDKSASVPRDSKLVLTKDLDPIWGRIGRDNSVGNPKGKSSQNTPKKTRSNGEHSKNNADSSNGMSLLLRETKTQTKPNIISAPSESISVLSDSKLSTIKTPEVFGFPLLSKQIPGSLIVGGGVGAISTNKSNFGFTNMRSNVIDSPTKNQSRTINKTKTEITQVFRQTMEQRIDPKSTSIVSVKQDIATESDTKNKRRVGPFYSLNLDAAVDSVLRVEEKSDTRVKTRMGYVTRPRTKPKTKPKPKIAGKKTKTSDDIYGDLMKSIDISVINPRIALKDIL